MAWTRGCATNRLRISPREYGMAIAPERKCKVNVGNSRCPLLNFRSHLAGPEVSVCAKFQVASSYSLGIKVPKVIYDLFSLGDSKIQDGCPKSISTRPNLRQLSVPCFKLIALELFELSWRSTATTNWLLCPWKSRSQPQYQQPSWGTYGHNGEDLYQVSNW